MEHELTFSLSYEQLTATTEKYILQCIDTAKKSSKREADVELDWARACLDHWHLLVQAGNAPAALIDVDKRRMTNLIWRYPTQETL